MRTISIENNKGGVGKTISTVNIAACLSQIGKRVLIVDLDNQANSTFFFKRMNSEALSIVNVLTDKTLDIHNVIVHTEHSNIDLLPSSPEIKQAEKMLEHDTVGNTKNKLKRALAQVKDEYDYCLIDCPPQINLLSCNALVASNDYIIPIKLDQFSLNGIQNLQADINDLREEYELQLNFLGCFVTMDENNVMSREVKGALADIFRDRYIDISIRKTVKVSQSTFDQVPLVFTDPKATASMDYVALTKRLFNI